MEAHPLVSIILPTYNRARLLQRSIDSVLSQTYPYWELIIWDDGSTDDTIKIISSYSDDRVQYFFEKNHGVSYARNRAIENSHGDYIAFLDSDDEWLPDKLASQVEILNTYQQIELLFSDFINIDEASHEKHRTFEHYSNALRLLNVHQVKDNLFIIEGGFLESLSVENVIATDTVIIRREIIENIGPFNEALRNFTDFELWWRMGLALVCIAYTTEVHLRRYKPIYSLSNMSLITCENILLGLDFCVQVAKLKGRNDLIPYLNNLYGNTWSNMITLYAQTKNGKGMLNAFNNSMKYGVNLGSIRLLFEALLSKGFI